MRLRHDLELLVAIYDEGGIQRAADALGVPRATLSKRLARLEKQLGVRLLNRNAHAVGLTAAGVIYYDHAKRVGETLAQAHRIVEDLSGSPSGVLRVTCGVVIGVSAVIPRLPDFHRRFPQVRVELSLSDAMEDLTASAFDVAVRYGALVDSALICRKAFSARRVICASPDYLSRCGTPSHPEDLRTHNCLNLTTLGRADNEWTFCGPQGERRRIAVSGNFTIDNGSGHYAAALAGIGVARVMLLRAHHDFERGRLVRLLADYEAKDEQAVYAVFPAAKPSAAARAFVDFLARFDAVD